MNTRGAGALALALCLVASGAAVAADIAIDGGLEQAGVDGFPLNPPEGDVLPPGWIAFTSNPANTVTTTDVAPFDGTYSAALTSVALSSNAVLKNANIGIGQIDTFQEVTISFWARGATAVGGVLFAEFFSELEGGGTSKAEILGNAPLPLDPDPNVWTQFTFNAVTGPDVGGGVTVQFAAIAGGAQGSNVEAFVDNLTVEADVGEPVPALPPFAVWLFAAAIGGAGLWSRRRSPQAA